MLRRRLLRSVWCLVATLAVALSVVAGSVSVVGADDAADGAVAQDCAVLRAASRAAASTARLRQRSPLVNPTVVVACWPPQDARLVRLAARPTDPAAPSSIRPIPIRC